jgi:M6 family metalloprotease-like protein
MPQPQLPILHPLRACLALVLAIVLVNPALGAPFAKKFNYTQPDGQRIQLWGEGTEFHAVFESLDGFTVVFDPASKTYFYARLSDDQSRLVSTGVMVGSGNAADLGLQQHLRISPEAAQKAATERYTEWDTGMGVSERWKALKEQLHAAPDGAQPSPPSNPTIGTKVGLTILVDFDDETNTVPQAEIVDFCNGDNYSGFGNNGSVKKYYQEVSNGRLTYSNVVTVYIRAPKAKTVYDDTSRDAGMQGRLLLNDVLQTMKAMTNYDTEILPLFNDLTVDGQNRVLACNVLFAGADSGVWSYGLWPHSWWLASPVELSPGGKRVYRYEITNIGDELTIGTFAHENGHLLCGFPDLYDYTGRSGGVGFYCLMDTGSYGGNPIGSGNNPVQVCAYLKRAAGWATTVDLNSSSAQFADLDALRGPMFNRFYRYAKPGTSTEYFLLESRFQTNRDSSVRAKGGILIWHIDELGDNSSMNLNPNTTHNNYEATVVQADNLWDLEKYVNSGDSRDLWYKTNSASAYNNTFTDVSRPNAHWWSGSPSGLVLRRFSDLAPAMSVLVGTMDPEPTNAVVTPASLNVIQGARATFTAAVSGFSPFSYQWRKQGSPISGATRSSYTINNVIPASAGLYSVQISNPYGTVTSSDVVLSVVPTLPLPEALDGTNLTWSTDDPNFWYGQAFQSHDGRDAAKTYPINTGESTGLRTLVAGPATLSFWWKVSSRTNADFLSFLYGGTTQARISGEVDWQQQLIFLPSGPQTLEWIYAKTAQSPSGSDAGWVDEVSLVPGPSAPVVLGQPQDLAVFAGTPAGFSVVAGGTPPLAYQWRFNGTPIPGATQSAYLIASPGTGNNGKFSVTISNAYGTTNSVEAALGVVPVAGTGNNVFSQGSVPPEASGAVAVAAGSWHSLAMKADGKVLAWGYNWNGECDVPAAATNAVAIAAGGYHSMAVTPLGKVICWGGNDVGQSTPPAGLRDVVAIAGGAWHSLALRADGTVVAWGDNSWGQTDVPAGLSGVVAIASGGNHNLALRSNGTVVAWGENTDAQGLYSGQSVVPWGLTNVVSIGAGEYHSIAVKSDGTVVLWGSNDQGQSQGPAGLSRTLAAAGGGSHTVALEADTTVLAWGNNQEGQCNVKPNLTNVIYVAAGHAHTLVLTGTGIQYPQVLRTMRLGDRFSLLVQTFAGRNYTLEYKSSLAAPSWTSLPTVRGTGAPQVLSDPAATSPQRFYRIRQW